jgi:hypothetical protein
MSYGGGPFTIYRNVSGGMWQAYYAGEPCPEWADAGPQDCPAGLVFNGPFGETLTVVDTCDNCPPFGTIGLLGTNGLKACLSACSRCADAPPSITLTSTTYAGGCEWVGTDFATEWSATIIRNDPGGLFVLSVFDCDDNLVLQASNESFDGTYTLICGSCCENCLEVTPC